MPFNRKPDAVQVKVKIQSAPVPGLNGLEVAFEFGVETPSTS
jgi:hypothetical protein